ncbi:MAG: hypothetical protein KAT65_26990 [Methanophagales archaeon]|nr:hypothetical protein [Methanophagales archaeon]
MPTQKSPESSFVSSNRNMSSLSRIPQFTMPYLQDAIQFPDIDTLSSILGIKRREAEKVVIRNNEGSAGHKVRDVFCTKETRELEKELLEIFSSYATTKKGKEMILTLTPSIDREELQKRFEDVKDSKKLVKVMGDAKITRVREIISKAEIEKRSFGKSPLIAIRNRGIEAEIKRNYGDFMRVELVDSADKAEELLQKENIVLLIGEEEGFDEPGIINIKIE